MQDKIAFAKPAKTKKTKTKKTAKRKTAKKSKVSSSNSGGPVNVNRASAEEIAANLHGIGPVRSELIVQARKKKKFTSLDDLRERVTGIGEVITETNKKNIRF